MFDKMKSSSVRDERAVRYLIPVKIVLQENAENASVLLTERPRQTAVGAPQSGCVIRESGFVLLDFGCELQGGALIAVASVSGGNAKLRLTFGESVSEAQSALGEKNATNDHALRDFVRPVGFLSTFRVGNTGFRFLKIEAVSCDCVLDCVQAAFEFRDIPYRGSFRSSDERLNRIWNTAAYTVHLNMQEYLWDGIKRDRLVWIGDMHTEVSTISAVFGYNAVVPKSLDFIRDVTSPDTWMNSIPSYSMWWIIIHRDWYLQNGDISYLRAQEDYMERLLTLILAQINPDGSNKIGAGFVDWSSNNTQWMSAGQNAMFVLSLQAGADICRWLGNISLSVRLESAAALCRTHHDPCAGNKQIAALCALAEIENAEKINREVLEPGGADGFSTFLGYYALQAMAEAGNTSGALSVIRSYWGGMLDLGATAFWEDFDIEWLDNAARIDEPVPKGKSDIHGDRGKFCYQQFRHSLCHGWASGPAPFLSRYVAGIRVLEPGCRRVLVKPQLCDLSYVECTYPTPFGDIRVHSRTEDGKTVTETEAPTEIRIES